MEQKLSRHPGSLYKWAFESTADRVFARDFTAAEIGKIALQEDTGTLWMLTAITPTWVQIGQQGVAGDDGSDAIIDTLTFRIPRMEDDSLLHFTAEMFTSAGYTGTAVESVDSATSRTNLKVFSGTAWIAFPSEGVGDPYYERKLSLSLQLIQPNTQYYLRYKWYIAGTADITLLPWFSAQYPALEVTNVADEPNVEA